MPPEICRICGADSNLKSIIAADADDNEELLEILRTCANIWITAADKLPKYICGQCEHGFRFAHKLRKLGQENERKLREELAEEEELTENKVKVEETSEETTLFSFDVSEVYEDEVHLVEEFIDFEPSDEQQHVEEGLDVAEQVVDVGEDADWEVHEADKEGAEEQEERDTQIVDYILESLDPELNSDAFSYPTSSSNSNSTAKAPSDHSDGRYKCDTCQKRFQRMQEYAVHIKVHGENRYQCPVCSKWFAQRFRLKDHMQIHEGVGAKCAKCEKVYSNQQNLERHIRVAHGDIKPFECKVCGMRFSRTDIFKTHMLKHSDERNFECWLCDKKFKAKFYLQEHLKKQHLKPRIRKKRTSQQVKEDNAAQLEANKPFVCDYCGKQTRMKTAHINHVRTHTGERPYKCPTCQKAFRTQAACKTHELCHADVRPFKCSICGNTFRQKAHLSAHLMAHSKTKRHRCGHCDKQFAMKSNLRVHERAHTGETPYLCQMCPERFLDLNKLKRHVANQHPATGSSFAEPLIDGELASKSPIHFFDEIIEYKGEELSSNDD